MIKNRRQLFFPILVFAVISSAIIAAWGVVDAAVNNFERTRFLGDVQLAFNQAREVFGFYNKALYAYQGFFEGSKEVERAEFAVYSKRVVFPGTYPGLFAAAYAERVQKEDLASFIYNLRNDRSANPGGYPNVKLYPAGDRLEYYIVKYAEPEAGNESVFGFDVYATSERKPAMEYARDTGEASATGRIQLMTLPPGPESEGFIIFLPIYRIGAPISTAEDRQKAIAGFVNLVFRSKDFFPALLDEIPNVDVEIFDGDAPSKENLLHDFDGIPRTFNPDLKSKFIETRQLEAGSRIWTLKFIATPDYKLSFFTENAPLFTLFTGFIFNFLISWIIYAFATREEKAKFLAEKMTAKFKQAAASEEQKTKEVTEKSRLLAEQNRKLQDSEKAMLTLLEDLNTEKIKLTEMNAKDEAMLASIGDGVIFTDKNRRVSLVNRFAEEMLGWKAGEAIGKTLTDMLDMQNEKGEPIPLEERPSMLALTKKKRVMAAAVTTIANIDHTILMPAVFFKRKNGAAFPAYFAASPVIVAGEIVGVILVFSDVTKERELDKAKNDFISIASHQLRTPLTGIRWTIERILKKETLSPKGKDYLNDLVLSAAQLSELIDTLLNVSRIEAGFVITPKPLEIAAFMESYLNECAALCVKKNIRLAFNKPENEISALTDESALRNIVQSLLSNAIEYTPADGKIKIDLEQKGDFFEIRVADTGIGIPEAEQTKIFQKFSRASNAKLMKPGGVGLGLYIAAQAVKYLGGKIWFKSEENKGSTFYLRLPMKSEPKVGYKGLA